MVSPATPKGSPRKPARRSGGIVIPHQPRWYQSLAAWLVVGAVHLVTGTLRYRFNDQSGAFDQPRPGPAIYCVWHNRLAVCLSGYFRYIQKRNPTPGLAALVSASKDGGFLSAILERFGVQPVRGMAQCAAPAADEAPRL